MVKFSFALSLVLAISIVFAASAMVGPTTCRPREAAEILCIRGDDGLDLIRLESKSGDKVFFRVKSWFNANETVPYADGEYEAQSGCRKVLYLEAREQRLSVSNCRLLDSNSTVNCSDVLRAYPV